MKRVFQHPPSPTSGRRYWRSTDELADTPEFREWLEREFPSSAAELNGDEWSRRTFLKLMGASVALAGFVVGLGSLAVGEIMLRLRGGEFAVGMWVVAELSHLLVNLDPLVRFVRSTPDSRHRWSARSGPFSANFGSRLLRESR